MAKSSNGNLLKTVLQIAGFTLSVVVILGGVFLAWGDQKKTDALLIQKVDTYIQSHNDKTETIEAAIVKNGIKCLKNEKTIVGIEKDIEFTAKTVESIQVEQRAIKATANTNLHIVLEAIKKNGNGSD